jgi:hypothetical protein
MSVNKIIILAFISLCLAFGACRKFISIPPPETQAQTSIIFENDQAAIAAATGLYSQIMSASLGITNGGTTLYPALSADEIYNTASNSDYDAFRSNEITLNATGLNRLWTFGYRNIYHANAVLEGLVASTGITDSIRKQLRGEMLVTRALHYFILVNMYGEIPLVKTTSFQTNQILPRSTLPEVHTFIMNDLLEAKTLLKDSYPSAGRVRPNKFAATALLARFYLYSKQWQLAEQEATEVINNTQYSLVTNLNNVFLANSAEAIWQFIPVTTIASTSEGNTFIPTSATTRPAFAFTPQLLAAFETSDQRKANWTKMVTISGQPYTYPFKYKVRTATPPPTENYMVLRLAEVYLNRAEARMEQNNIAGAQQDLNRVRTRAGLSNTTANTQDQLRIAIMQERRIELMTEWGHRWFDLKRWEKAHEILSAIKTPGWQSTDVLYPISQYDLDTNPFLEQNPGY